MCCTLKKDPRLMTSTDKFGSFTNPCSYICFILLYPSFRENYLNLLFQLSQLLTGKIPGIPIMHHSSKDRVGAF